MSDMPPPPPPGPTDARPHESRPAGQRNGVGVTALVLGILAILTGLFVIGGLLGIVAVVLGFIGRGRAKRGEASNGGVALAGIITGAIGIVLAALIVALGIWVFSTDEFQNLRECLEAAGDEQAEIDECSDAFEADLNN